jgi:hypothetical protein
MESSVGDMVRVVSEVYSLEFMALSVFVRDEFIWTATKWIDGMSTLLTMMTHCPHSRSRDHP